MKLESDRKTFFLFLDDMRMFLKHYLSLWKANTAAHTHIFFVLFYFLDFLFFLTLTLSWAFQTRIKMHLTWSEIKFALSASICVKTVAFTSL